MRAAFRRVAKLHACTPAEEDFQSGKRVADADVPAVLAKGRAALQELIAFWKQYSACVNEFIGNCAPEVEA